MHIDIARISGDHLIPAGILDSIWNICVDLQRANRHEEVYQVISLSNSLFAGSVNMKIMFSAMLIKSYLELGKATKPSISKHVRRISRECLNLV